MICVFMMKADRIYEGVLTQEPGEDEEREKTKRKQELERRNSWIIVVSMECFICATMVGAGMMFKYWPLFFKKDLSLDPGSVCLLQAFVLLAMTFGNYLSSFFASVCGPIQVIYVCQSSATMVLYMISTMPLLPVPATAALVLLRQGVQACGSPIMTAVLMDYLPPEYRGRCSIMGSMRKMGWSASAGLGGVLSDRYGYLFNFSICAIGQFSAQLLLLPISFIQRRQRNG